MLDTGANNTTISLRLAKELGLKLVDGDFSINAMGIKEKAWRTDVPNLSLGVVTRQATPVDVMDMAKLHALHKEKDGVEIDGILGANFLESYSAVIDYRNRKLYLHDPWAHDRLLMQGTWKGTALVHAGDVVTDADYISRARVSVRGTTITFEYSGIVYSGKLELEPTKTPRALWMTSAKRNGEPLGEALLWQYEIDENTLRLLIPMQKRLKREELPTTLKSTPENGAGLWTFERIKYEPAPPPRPKAARP